MKVFGILKMLVTGIIGIAVLLFSQPATYCGKITDTTFGETVRLSADERGPSVSRLHNISDNTKQTSTSRGVWGGHMNRLVTTRDGVYTAYFTGSGDGEKVPRPFALYGLKNDSEGWTKLGEGTSMADSVITLADSLGNVYVVTFSSMPLSSKSGVLTIYVYTPENGLFCKKQNIFAKLEAKGHGYLTATMGKNDKIYVASVHGDDQGYVTIDTYNTANGLFSCRTTMETSKRYCYHYLHADSEGNVEMVAGRDVLYWLLGYSTDRGDLGFNYAFDGMRYWKLTQPFTGCAKTDITLAQATPSLYTKDDPLPSLTNNFAGDTYWDDRGRCHVLYMGSFLKPGEPENGTHLALIQGEQVVYDDVIFPNQSSQRLTQDDKGRFYLIRMQYNTDLLELYGCTDGEGRHYEKMGEVRLGSGLLQYAGLYLATVRGGTPRQPWVDILYPTADEGNELKWVYFRLNFYS